jgi:UDP-N-acetylglucosamine 2-epimerase (hydrolysing)
MSSKRHIAFLTGTRADFGKIKPLIVAAHEEGCRVSVFATGMHMLPRFGSTVLEV